MIDWRTVTPQQALNLDLLRDLRYTAPLNEQGERCAWPWEPQQLTGAPVGQYHCPYCSAMVMAGMMHLDYADEDAGAAS